MLAIMQPFFTLLCACSSTLRCRCAGLLAAGLHWQHCSVADTCRIGQRGQSGFGEAGLRQASGLHCSAPIPMQAKVVPLGIGTYVVSSEVI